MWDNDKKVAFVESVRGEMFQNIIIQAKDLLTRSVDEAVNCLNSGLLEAAACMMRRIYKGTTSSKWFDVECKAARTETRKWWRNLGARNMRGVKAGIGCSMLSVGNHSENC